MKSRNSVLAILSLLMMTMLVPTASADDHRSGGDLRLLTNRTAAITQGGSGWVALNWTTGEEAADFKVVVTEMSDGLTATYPTNTGTWTGLMNGPVLSASEVDFTAIKVAVPDDYRSSSARIVVKVSYLDDGELESEEFRVKIPVVKHNGEDLSQVSESATVEAGQPTWVNVAFAGHAPQSAGFSLVVTNSDGLDITYPAYGTSTSLYGDDTLEAGETDTASFFVDTAEAGTHTISFEVKYDAGKGTRTEKGKLLITVSG